MSPSRIRAVADAIAGAREGGSVDSSNWLEAIAAVKAADNAEPVRLPAKYPPHVTTDAAQVWNTCLDRVHIALKRHGIAWTDDATTGEKKA